MDHQKTGITEDKKIPRYDPVSVVCFTMQISGCFEFRHISIFSCCFFPGSADIFLTSIYSFCLHFVVWFAAHRLVFSRLLLPDLSNSGSLAISVCILFLPTSLSLFSCILSSCHFPSWADYLKLLVKSPFAYTPTARYSFPLSTSFSFVCSLHRFLVFFTVLRTDLEPC